MGKAINGLVNRSEEAHEERNVIRLSCVDVLHPKGSRDKAIVKKSNRNPHTKVVTKVREVTYLYNNEKTSKGFEIVEEVSVSLLHGNPCIAVLEPEVVGSITRDYRFEVPLKPNRYED